MVSTLFDPLGLLCLIIIQMKAILQKLCVDERDWDDLAPSPLLFSGISFYMNYLNSNILLFQDLLAILLMKMLFPVSYRDFVIAQKLLILPLHI